MYRKISKFADGYHRNNPGRYLQRNRQVRKSHVRIVGNAQISVQQEAVESSMQLNHSVCFE